MCKVKANGLCFKGIRIKNKVAENLKEFLIKEDTFRYTGQGYIVGYGHSKDLDEYSGSTNIYLGLDADPNLRETSGTIFSGHPIVVKSKEDLKDIFRLTIEGGVLKSFPYIVVVKVEYQFRNLSVYEHENNRIIKVADSLAFKTTSFSLDDLDKID